jgi:hypothetical protein
MFRYACPGKYTILFGAESSEDLCRFLAVSLTSLFLSCRCKPTQAAIRLNQIPHYHRVTDIKSIWKQCFESVLKQIVVHRYMAVHISYPDNKKP